MPIKPGDLCFYAPRGSKGIRWDIKAGTARQVRVLLVGAIDEPRAVRWCTADGETLPNGTRVADCLIDDLVTIKAGQRAPGRPSLPPGLKRDTRLPVKFTPAEAATVRAAAEAAGMTVSEYIRQRLGL